MTTLFEFSTIIEAVKKGMEKSLEAKEAGETGKLEAIDAQEFSLEKVPLEEPVTDTMEKTNDAEKYTMDDIGLQQKTAEYGDPDYINEIRNQNEKIDQVLSKHEESLRNDPSDLNYQRVDEQLERYKGTIFEHELKNTLKGHFEMVEDKQQVVKLEWGETKPDVILRGATEDMSIGELEIKKGEDLYIEAKCGSPEYIRNEMGHMLQQVEGHDGNSLVVVTKDYLEINPEVRADFEKKLAEKDSYVYVADVTSTEISMGLTDTLRL